MSKNTGTSELINYFTLGASGAVDIGGNLTLSSILNATTDTDKFLVSDTGIIKYRTGAELLSDIGAAPATGGSYLPLAGGTLTGALNGTSATFSGTVNTPLLISTLSTSTIINDGDANIIALDNTAQAIGTGGSISLGGKYNTAGSFIFNAIILKAVKETATSGQYGFGLAIGTRIDGSANPTEKIRITSTGNVGIGTASPTSQSTGTTTGILDVSASAGGNLVLHRTGSSDTALFSILKASNGTYIDSVGAATAANNAIYFRTNNINADQTTVTTALTIASSGNVGIVTTTPSAVKPTTTNGWASNLPSRVIEIAPDNSALNGANAGLFLRNNNATTGFDLWSDNWFGDCYLDNRYNGLFIFRNNTNATATERMRITSGGNVLIGTTTDSGQGKLQVNGRVYGDGFRSSSSILGFFKNSTGSFDWEIGSDAFVGTGMYMYNGTNGYVFRLTAAGVLTTSGGGTSDRRTKEDINPINESVLSFINELNPVSFKFINDVNKKTRRGFIAQEVLETSIPDLVLGDGDKQGGTYGLDYDGILALAIKAIQEQQEQIQELKNKLL